MKFRSIAITMLVLVICGAAHGANTDKTLVSWVTITDKNIRAGSVITVQLGAAFDGIIFAERTAGKWRRVLEDKGWYASYRGRIGPRKKTVIEYYLGKEEVEASKPKPVREPLVVR